jgi:hypothetical protein
MTIDDESPPGSWQREIELQPWKYPQQMRVEWALYEIRLRGLRTEATILSQEIDSLKKELESLRGNRR